jgi:hypothetical protein
MTETIRYHGAGTKLNGPPLWDRTLELLPHMAEALRWSDQADVLWRIHDDYVEELHGRLGLAMSRLHDEDPKGGTLAETDLRQVPSEAFMRVLTAPQTSSQLLWRNSESSVVEFGRYLHRSFVAESACDGRRTPITEEIWTALGDRCALPHGVVLGCPPLGGRLALDFDSPQILDVDMTGRRRRMSPLPADVRPQTLSCLNLAYDGIVRTSQHLARVVTSFIKVLMLQSDPDRQYGSGSCQEHIGRAVIASPQLIDEVRIAEAIVHEAVHAVLYMQLQGNPWGLVGCRGAQEGHVVSPWTGNPLPLSAYLHACFVWYALVHFWGLALSRNAFSVDRILPRMARALVGFQKGPLLAALDESSLRSVRSEIQESVHTLQVYLLDSMGAA